MAACGGAEDLRAVSDTARSIRGLLGSLVAVPLVAAFFGSQWSWGERLEVPHWVLPPLPWVVWCGLWLARRSPVSASAVERALEVWRRADLWVAAGAIYSILFRVTAPGVTGAMAASAILAGVFLLRRAPIVTASVIATVALCIAFVPKVLTAIVVERVSEQYDLTIDHRLKPNRKHINSDGIRFQGEAHDVKEEEFVILFLGDSFTFGTRLINRRTYPRAFQAFVSQRECTAPVRSVNFGWPSASPLLSLRLLRQIGYKYKPDLVVYSLDVTDFHDDLRYEQALRSAGDYEVDSSQLLRQFIDRKLPWLNVDLADVTGLSGLLRPRRPRNADSSGDELELPADRFFVTKYPLDETRAWIERGVMKNLAAIHDFATGTLEVPTVLVIYPRAYQYSDREAPKNWEARAYETLGPFVREPFRYFEEVTDRLPYPVVNLLPAFETSRTFPLYFEDDPHWNPNGARLAAETAARAIHGLGLVPCENP
jgi:hypothetical protein